LAFLSTHRRLGYT
jgi:hypothetical protein